VEITGLVAPKDTVANQTTINRLPAQEVVETLKEILVMIIDRIFLVLEKTPTHKGVPKRIPMDTPTRMITITDVLQMWTKRPLCT
jgi:hypothetical protein